MGDTRDDDKCMGCGLERRAHGKEPPHDCVSTECEGFREHGAWVEREVGDYAVRARAINEACATFEVHAEEYDGAETSPIRRRIVHGHVKFDGCANVDLERDDGVMHHFCGFPDLLAFTRALEAAYVLASEQVPSLMDDLARVDDGREQQAKRVLVALAGESTEGLNGGDLAALARLVAAVAQRVDW